MHEPTHSLIVIHATTQCFGCEEVVRWCPTCGAIVIDTDYDGRTKPGDAMPMRFPTETKR